MPPFNEQSWVAASIFNLKITFILQVVREKVSTCANEKLN